MKTFLKGILGFFIIVLLVILSLFAIKYFLLFVFNVMDYNAILGGILLIVLLVVSVIVAGFAKTREQLPSIRQFLSKSHHEAKKDEEKP